MGNEDSKKNFYVRFIKCINNIFKEEKMNIRTNYPVQSIQTCSINNKVKSHQESTQNYSNNDVNFTGLSNIIKPLFQKTVKLDSNTRYFLEQLGSILDISTEKMFEAAKGKTEKQIKFLNALTERFNIHNFQKPDAEKESGELVLDLFNRVKEPKQEHIKFVRNVDLSMTDIKQCFDRCKDDPKKIDKIESLYSKLGHTADKNDLASQIINSPNMFEYVDNANKYIPHFNTQKETKGLIASIDKQMESKTVDLTSSYKNSEIDCIIKSFPENSGLTKEALYPKFSEEGLDVLSDIRIKLSPTQKSMQEGDLNGLLKIYNSTTPENVKFRKEFLKNNYYNFGQRESMGQNEINELSALFELADKDPATMKFLDKLSTEYTGLRKAGEYFKIIDVVGSEKLSDNVKVIKQLIRKNNEKSSDAIIAYFENGGSKMDKCINGLKSLLGIKSKPIKPVSDIVTISPMTKVMSNIAKKPYVAPSMTEIPMGKMSILPTGKISPEMVIKPTIAKQPNAKKLTVINDVNNVIEKKLGAKTLSEQSRIYADKATKIRLSMLPEIFESIKETRAAERAKGTFSKSKSVSNSDAVDLYTRINGKNKKLVNYMLKKRNADGTRMFNVRDIIDTLADANKEVLKGKAGSTKLNRFSAKDERAIYENIFEQKVSEYGKLKRSETVRKANHK